MSKTSKRNMDQGLSSLVHSVANSFKSERIGTFYGSDGLDLVEEWIPTRSKAINYVCGDPLEGAFPQGKITEIYGPKSSAKSVIGYDALKEVQEMGGIAILIDSEAAFHRGLAKAMGVKLDKLIYAMLETVEESYEFIYSAVTKIREKSDCPILVLWDSIAASKTVKEQQEDMLEDKSQPGIKAKATGRVMQKLNSLASSENVTVIIINQIRKKIGILWGNPETTTSGEAIAFYASLQIEVRKSKVITGKGKQIIGHLVKVSCVKNKVRPPFLKTVINVWTDRNKHRYGLDKWSGICDLLVADNILHKSGGYYTLTSNTDIKFREKDLFKYWNEHIVPVLRKIDLYETKKKAKRPSGTKSE